MEFRQLQRRIQRRLAHLPPGARRDLLGVLSSPSQVRADLIRQMCGWEATRDLAEVLKDLEADRVLALNVMEVLKETL